MLPVLTKMSSEIIRMSDLSDIGWKGGVLLVNRNCDFPQQDMATGEKQPGQGCKRRSMAYMPETWTF